MTDRRPLLAMGVAAGASAFPGTGIDGLFTDHPDVAVVAREPHERRAR